MYQEESTLEQFQIVLNLFPRLESLKIGMDKNEVKKFIHFLPLKTNGKTHPLCLLCVS